MVKLTREYGDITLDWDGGYLQLYEQLSQFFHPREFNWLDIDLIKFNIELDRTFGQLEIDLGVLGLGIYFVQVYDTKANEKKAEEYAKAMKRGPFVEVKPYGGDGGND